MHACAKSLQSCQTHCDPINCSQPSSPVHGVLQAGILEWAAMPSSRGPSRPRDQTSPSCFSCIGRQVVLYHSCHVQGPPRCLEHCKRFMGNLTHWLSGKEKKKQREIKNKSLVSMFLCIPRTPTPPCCQQRCLPPDCRTSHLLNNV